MRPLSAVVPINSSPVMVKARSNHQDIPINSENLRNNVDDPMEIRSALSTSKRQKVPQSMKKFLKQRKLLRQVNPNPKPTIESINDSRKKILNQSNVQLKEHPVANEHQIDLFVESNNSNLQIADKKQQQRSHSMQKSIKTLICPICQGQITDANLTKIFTCRHIYCQECAKSYVKFKINMFEEVPCPQQSCASLLNIESELYKNLNKRQRRLYKKIHNFYITQADPLKKLCPKEQCQGLITLQEGNPQQECPTCKIKFCSNCFFEVHKGQCRDYEIKFMEDTLHYRQCGRCQVVVERTQGCNHMTCKCGYQFCYICGKAWTHNHICKIQDNEEDNGCDWGQNWQDHFMFLIKLPLKFILTSIYTSFWFSLSFAAAPYNLFFFIYWILLILCGGPGEFIFEQDRPCWQIFLLLLIFPLLMIYCLPLGIRLFLDKFHEQCPFLSQGYRCIIRM